MNAQKDTHNVVQFRQNSLYLHLSLNTSLIPTYHKPGIVQVVYIKSVV